MQRITAIARVVLGLVFVTFSLNYFLHFLPEPKDLPPGAIAFAVAFTASGLMTFVKIVELAAGLALIGNRAVPLALALLAPIIVGITGFHAGLAPSGLPIAALLIGLELFLAWRYRGAFAPMLAINAAPARSPERVRQVAPQVLDVLEANR